MSDRDDEPSRDPLPIVFSPVAARDLDEMYVRGAREWGEDQANRHDEEFRRALSRLASFPWLGRARDDIAPGYRGLAVGNVVIFYRLDARTDGGTTVFIARILHAVRHASRHLS